MECIDPFMLSGKVAWVTASARGLGRAIAERLARCGASIAVHSRSDRTPAEFGEAPSTRQVAKEIADLGGRVHTVFADLTDPDQVQKAVSEIEGSLGGIDILVNNAGGDIAAAGGKPQSNDAIGISFDDLQAVIDRNLVSTILCCRAVVPGMMRRGKGKIVNIGSVDGFTGAPEGSIYSCAKAAQAHYTRCLAAQLRPHGITVNMVAPGGTLTARFLATGQAKEALLRTMDTPSLVRHARPDEVACVVQFFVSPLAGFVSGQMLRVDGGEQLSPA